MQKQYSFVVPKLRAKQYSFAVSKLHAKQYSFAVPKLRAKQYSFAVPKLRAKQEELCRFNSIPFYCVCSYNNRSCCPTYIVKTMWFCSTKITCKIRRAVLVSLVSFSTAYAVTTLEAAAPLTLCKQYGFVVPKLRAKKNEAREASFNLMYLFFPIHP
ncbi:hypothetical protein ACOMCU_27615 [Lysinibacillus sp. UGB7]|uniref:hypothetical protein n=1 Tax=Lysinibacillus sp. UGB7 TaxID=3411039 RepID=UPI003B7E320B